MTTYLLLAVPAAAAVGWLSVHEWRAYRRLEETRRRYYASMDRYATTRGGGHVWLTAADSPTESPRGADTPGGARSRDSDGSAV